MAKDAAYHRAEQRIDATLRAKVSELDLSGLKISELPESICGLSNLRKLDLYNNNLTSLPDQFGKLNQLRFLNLENNAIQKLPESIGELSHLLRLDLSRNNLTGLPTTFSKLSRLTYLKLISNNIKTLPDSFGKLNGLRKLNLYQNQLTYLPESIGDLKELQDLFVSRNLLKKIPNTICNLRKLDRILLYQNELSSIPASIGELRNLTELRLEGNEISALPDTIGDLSNLRILGLGSNNYGGNKITNLPASITKLEKLVILRLEKNPLNPELAAAYKQGVDEVKTYLRAKAAAQVTLNEAKLILVGEGEVGKTCLMDALLGKPFREHDTTHGIEVNTIKLIDPDSVQDIFLNGWDFGGQRVYRPTHQLFFSAPAIYLVVWKPREGPQQGFVKEWIQLVKRREPSAKILVVATHGGPQQRQPDIDRQELWDLFGKETVVDFLHVESKPNEYGFRKGIRKLQHAIARIASTLPDVGRTVPKSFADVRATLHATGAPYLALDKILAICRAQDMDDEIASLFITISHRLGHLTHYGNDPALRDIVILRPDWLATAMSYVLDDEETRKNHGLVDFSRLSHLWNNPTRSANTRYPTPLHRTFLRLMERFDLSYRVAGLSKDEDVNPISLIAQLVPGTTPKEEKFSKAWTPELAPGDIQQTQICRIVDAGNGQSANAEGLFYQLIVRLHRYSLGRVKYGDSVHWQRGLILDADYNGRALLRHIGNDVHITVRAAYPQGFLNTLTDEVKYLVESFWEGLRCEVTVPCMATPECKGLFEVSKLIENKKRGREEVPCTTCNEWQSVDSLLLNVPAAQPAPSGEALASQQVITQLTDLRHILIQRTDTMIGRFDNLDSGQKELLSKAETSYQNLIKIFTDEAKEGPRLFSLVPVNRSGFNPKQWTSAKFKLILWCEHSRWPLAVLNGKDSNKGIYEFELTHEWFKKVAPVLKTITSTLSIVLPIASSAVKFVMNENDYKAIENELNFGKDVINGVLSGAEKTEVFVDAGDYVDLPYGISIRAENAALRELHTLLKAKDPGFGGLVRVMNKRQEFLWVHEQFAGEY